MQSSCCWRTALAFAALVWGSPVARAGPTGAEPRRVLEVFQNEWQGAAHAAFHDALREGLPPAPEVAFDNEVVDPSRAVDPAYRAAFHAWLGTKYAGSRPDVIVAVGEGAVGFLADPEATPWPGVPVVFGVVDDRSPVLARLPKSFTGVADHFPVQETIELALRLFPASRRAVLYGGASQADAILAGVLRQELAPYRNRLEVEDLVGLPTVELLDRLHSEPDGSIVLGLSYLVDGVGKRFTGQDITRAMADLGKAPLLTTHAHILGYGTLGGVVVDFGETGRRAARLVERVLAGEPPSAIPMEHGGPYRMVLDGRELERWRVPDERVPAAAEIRFRGPSVWDRYRWHAAAVLCALGLETLLIAGLLVERRRRRTAERSARENLAVVAHMNRVGAIGELAGSFAHELNSPLGAVVNNAQAARRFLANGKDQADEVVACLDDIVGDARRVGEVVRRMRGALRREDARPVPLDLAAVIRDAVRLVSAEARDHDVDLSMDVALDLPTLSGDDVQLVQVVVNLVMNAIDAVGTLPPDRRRVAVAAAPVPDGVEIRVVDTGPGIPPPLAERVFDPFFTTKPGGLGLGLAISRSIVEAHGGKIRVAPGPEEGTEFHVFLPAVREPREHGKPQIAQGAAG